MPLAFPIVNPICVALLYGCAAVWARNGGLRPAGQNASAITVAWTLKFCLVGAGLGRGAVSGTEAPNMFVRIWC